MNLSGIAVSVQADRFDDTVSKIEEIPGVEVYYRDPSSHRVVVVQEADSVDAEVSGLKQIKSIPGVVVAELVYHYFAEDESITNQLPRELDAETGISASIMHRLNPTAD